MPPPCPTQQTGDVVYVVEEGWHAEIGIPVAELDHNMQMFGHVFDGAETIMFGYGKKTFVTAPVDTWSEYMLGPVPGPAVIQAVGLSVMPDEAYPAGDVVKLTLPHGGAQALSAYVWNDFIKGANGKPKIVGPSRDPEGIFYAAVSQYNLFHTCNTWTVDALQATGLAVSPDNVIFSGQAMDQVYGAARKQCTPLL